MTKDENQEKYFNFPIHLLKGFMKHSSVCLNNILEYSIYAHSEKLEYSNDLERFESSLNYYEIKVPEDKNVTLAWLKNGEHLYLNKPEKCPMVGLRLGIFWDFYNNHKREIDKICLLGFLSIKSILQNKPYCKIDNKFWLSRMEGNATSVDYFEDLDDNIRIYANEYQTKKIKSLLSDHWGLITYARYTKGFYVSFSLTIEELAYQVEKNRILSKQKKQENAQKTAQQLAIERLRNEGLL
ncbi:hypothetical protein ABGT15_12115 [Flavobacterium enshiense]|uniref:hypothetical protein n=1 Tax=Flavobacterium enshiense TaxID=1341165 RepID=UPI00345D5504